MATAKEKRIIARRKRDVRLQKRRAKARRIRVRNAKLRRVLFPIITLVFIATALWYAFFEFRAVFIRMRASVLDLVRSVVYYFSELFELGAEVSPTVTEIPSGSSSPLPMEWGDFKADFLQVCRLMVDKSNVLEYVAYTGEKLGRFSQMLIPLLFLFLILGIFAFLSYRTPTKKHNQDTKPLKICKWIGDRTVKRAVRLIKRYLNYLRCHKWFRITLIAIWLYNLNFFTIVIEAVAYLFYFSISSNLISIYTQVIKLGIDLSVAVDFIPVWIQTVFWFWVFHKIRWYRGMQVLKAREKYNEKFLEEHPGALLIVGKQRMGKTTMLTDMALTQGALYRKKAEKKMNARKKQFPFFPWINVAMTIDVARKRHSVYTLASCREFVRLVRSHYENSLKPTEEQTRSGFNVMRYLRNKYGYRGSNFCFGYDLKRYPTTYNDGLREVNIFDAIEAFAQLYFIQTAPTPLVFGNYSIRCDEKKKTVGNMPKYDLDFFKRKAETLKRDSQYCHILDWDMVRQGKLMNPRNPNKDALEFGVLAGMEIAKERGNQNTLVGVKKDAPECNQKNDGFETDMKMVGHRATVDYEPFFRPLYDEQRPDSLGADNKELCDVIMIKSVKEAKIVMPFCSLEQVLWLGISKLYDWIEGKLSYLRGDNTLLMHTIKTVYQPYNRFYERIRNQFNVSKASINVWNGMDDEMLTDKGKYYISDKKDKSERFATDGIGSFYHEKAMRSKRGINDVPQYQDKHMSWQEMSESGSHFYNALSVTFDIEQLLTAQENLQKWLAEEEAKAKEQEKAKKAG